MLALIKYIKHVHLTVIQTMNEFNREIDHEAKVNHLLRNPHVQLQRSLSIPIPSSWEQHVPIWCTLTLRLMLVGNHPCIATVWQKVIEYVQDRIGYIRTGSFTHGQDKICISSKIDLFEQVDLMHMKYELQQLTGVVCKMDMEQFSFCEEPKSN